MIVLVDFDATISTIDVGDEVIARLAPLSAAAISKLRAGQLTSRQVWEDSIPRVFGRDREIEALTTAVQIDPAFHSFLAFCRRESIPVAVLSDGFKFYIERILTRYGLGDLTVFCNEMDETGRLIWPNSNSACDRCGCCKPTVVRRAKDAGSHVVYVGDGTSDFYAAVYADWVFARSTLERYIKAQGSPYFPFPDFAFVQSTLADHLASFRDGSMGGRARVTTDVCAFPD